MSQEHLQPAPERETQPRTGDYNAQVSRILDLLVYVGREVPRSSSEQRLADFIEEKAIELLDIYNRADKPGP
jgi:hypothetical protein